MELVLFHYTFLLLVQTLLCMIFPDLDCVCFFSLFTATLPGQLIFDFPHWESNSLPTHTLEKMRPEKSSGESFKAVQRSWLQKQIIFTSNTDISDKKHIKGNRGDWFFSWHIIFHLSNVFPSPATQPQPTHPIPGSYYIRENWERMARETVSHWTVILLYRRQGSVWGGKEK